MIPPLLQEPPPRPKGKLDVFWDRNWKWFVPALCVAAMLMIFIFISFVFAFMKQSDAYTGALGRARSSPEVVAAIGTPIRDGLFVMGNVNVSGSSGRADLAFPISGPKGTAMVYVDATRALGEWNLDRVVVQIDGDGQRIDLSDGRPTPYRPADDKPEPDPPVTR
ncbi:MAG TPA: cytochrome c oxidase assembly factor 1 family protein [Opitutaceae bacterium]